MDEGLDGEVARMMREDRDHAVERDGRGAFGQARLRPDIAAELRPAEIGEGGLHHLFEQDLLAIDPVDAQEHHLAGERRGVAVALRRHREGEVAG